MKIRIIAFLIAIVFIKAYAYSASDSTSFNGFNFNLNGAYYWVNESYDIHAKIPGYFSEKSDNKAIVSYVDSKNKQINSTDNPLRHAPVFLDFNLNYKGYGFKINSDLVVEHRGVSYGTYSKAAMIVYPKISFSFDTVAKIFNNEFRVGVAAGHRDNLRLMEGLNFYNMDCQGINYYIKWKKFKYEFFDIGDLVNQIGLNIDGAHHHILTYEENVKGGYNVTLALASFDYDIYGGFTTSISFSGKHAKIYAQYAERFGSYIGDNKNNSAVLAGINYHNNFEKFDINCTGEYRYYGSVFNLSHCDTNVTFRNRNIESNIVKENSYNNTIGENLYPLSFYERPFSQWAVFAEYQKRNVLGISLVCDAKYKFYDDFFLKANIDLNYINASFLDSYLYKFLTFSLGWEPFKNNYVSAGATNKSMNLDKHYPTFYELAKLNFFVKFNVGLNILGDKNNAK